METSASLPLCLGTEASAEELRLAPGSRILFFSDGAFEGRAEGGEFFDLQSSLARHVDSPDSSARCSIASLKIWTATALAVSAMTSFSSSPSSPAGQGARLGVHGRPADRHRLLDQRLGGRVRPYPGTAPGPAAGAAAGGGPTTPACRRFPAPSTPASEPCSSWSPSTCSGARRSETSPWRYSSASSWGRTPRCSRPRPSPCASRPSPTGRIPPRRHFARSRPTGCLLPKRPPGPPRRLWRPAHPPPLNRMRPRRSSRRRPRRDRSDRRMRPPSLGPARSAESNPGGDDERWTMT